MGRLIGIAGKARSGKSTAASLLEDYEFKRVSFATPLKNMASMLLLNLGMSTYEVEHHMDYKEIAITRLGVTMRELLQTLGTEWGRNMIHRDLWLIAAGAGIDKAGGDVVIDDVRFENEAMFIRSRGGLIVHLVRDEVAAVRLHASESGIKRFDGDVIIANNDSLAAFETPVCRRYQGGCVIGGLRHGVAVRLAEMRFGIGSSKYCRGSVDTVAIQPPSTNKKRCGRCVLALKWWLDKWQRRVL